MKLTRKSRGAGVSMKMGVRFAALLAQGIVRDRTKARSDGHLGKETVALPPALKLRKATT